MRQLCLFKKGMEGILVPVPALDCKVLMAGAQEASLIPVTVLVAG